MSTTALVVTSGKRLSTKVAILYPTWPSAVNPRFVVQVKWFLILILILFSLLFPICIWVLLGVAGWWWTLEVSECNHI